MTSQETGLPYPTHSCTQARAGYKPAPTPIILTTVANTGFPSRQSHLNQGNPLKQPSFRRKPESRKSPGKERSGYREFWIPAFAGTTGLCCDCPAMRKGGGHINPCWHHHRGRGGFVTRPTVNGKHRPANRWGHTFAGTTVSGMAGLCCDCLGLFLRVCAKPIPIPISAQQYPAHGEPVEPLTHPSTSSG